MDDVNNDNFYGIKDNEYGNKYLTYCINNQVYLLDKNGSGKEDYNNLKEYIERHKKYDFSIYSFDTPQEMLKWFKE